jgi:hypothetical protein
MTLIKEQTASSSSSISFVDGSSSVVLDSTYPIYIFKFINIHPSTYSRFVFQADVNGGSSYNQTITSTKFNAYNQEHSGTSSGLEYQAGGDQAQGTSFQRLTNTIGYGAGYADNDQAVSGHLTILNPSSTTFVKHFIATTNHFDAYFCYTIFTAGYFNTTNALDRFQFKYTSGTMDSGTIKLYGIKGS